MIPDPAGRTYKDLARIADRLFMESEDNEEELADALDTLDGNTRDELLVSDLLNAYQVFYYFFREVPEEIVKERLLLLPASSLVHPVTINETGFTDVIFIVENKDPVIELVEDDETYARYEGKDAYRKAMQALHSIF